SLMAFGRVGEASLILGDERPGAKASRMALSAGYAEWGGVERARINTGDEIAVPAWFYTLRLRSGVLYPGATTDLERRWAEHDSGAACRTTLLDPPADLA